MKRTKTSTRFLIASPLLCAAFVAGWLITSRIVLAATNPIPGVGVIVQKKPGGKKPSNARTNQDGKFTIENLDPGSYTLTLKHTDYSPSANFKTLVIVLEGVRGGKVEKRFPISELRGGITFDIEIERSNALMGTCMASDQR